MFAEEKYRAQVRACREQLDWAHQLLTPWSGREPEVGEHLITAEGVRATKSYGAAVDLCERGYGPQAAMLNRSIFEGSMIAHWVSLNIEEAARRYAEHHRFSQIIWADKLKVDLDTPPTAEERTHLRREYGTYGGSL